ncbi:MAG: hydantoinase/oxoprolinase family protein [Geminicoccaceae bacterium]|nr:MAG: hydantoinase/oxoprolinase family protein [Geminicoccaceae bacterium]
MSNASALLVGIDVGGTFTDCVAVDRLTGASVAAFKLPSTPADPAVAVLAALARVGADHALEGAHVCHGTTIGTNALLERKGTRTALVATQGFADVLELRRQARPELYTFDVRLSPPLVAALDRFEVAERIAFDGEVLLPLEGTDDLAERLAAQGVGAVAVSLLHAPANPAHEQRLAATLRRRLPGVFVSVSSEVAPEIREYERTSTTVVNAYIGPAVGAYVDRLAAARGELGLASLRLVKSSGGLTSPEVAAALPVHLVESGPAAGLIASAHFGVRHGRLNLLAFDMGGTTAKAGVVRDGSPRRVHEFHADALVDGRNLGGYPILSSVIDVVEIGAGGGSLASLDEAGVIKVGPESAGARPGPACYGQGGERPTVTDAHAVIGTLVPRALEASGIAVDPALAGLAIDRRIAAPLGWTQARAAHAIVALAVAKMAEMVRLATVRRGLDPRDFVLVPSGGAGPLHAVAIAREVGISEVLVPPWPGMFSALGALLADVRHDLSASVLRLAGELDDAYVRARFAELEQRAAALMAVEPGVAEVTIERLADLRFRGQLFHLTLPVPPHTADLEAAFRRAFVDEYGFDLPDAAVEVVTLRLVAKAPGFGAAITTGLTAQQGLATTVELTEADGSRQACTLVSPDRIEGTLSGPALVVIGGACLWLPAGATARCLDDGSLAVDVGERP